MICRCTELREAFGHASTPDCGPCVRARRREALATTHTQVHSELGAYLDRRGVEVVRLSEDDQWSPQWALSIFEEFPDAKAATPVLDRAATDMKFRADCQQIIDLCTYGVWMDDEKTAADRMTLHLAEVA